MENLVTQKEKTTILESLSLLTSKVSTVIAEISNLKEIVEQLSKTIDANEHCVCKNKVTRSRNTSESPLDEETLTIQEEKPMNKKSKTNSHRSLITEEPLEETQIASIKEEKHIYKEKERKRRSTKDTDTDCLAKALQENIVTLVEDVPFVSSGLQDYLIGNDCLTGDECVALRSLNNKDQIRNTVRLIKGRSFDVMKKFVKCVQRFNPEVSDLIWKSFETNKRKSVNEKLCIFCRVKRSVDVRYVADHVWSIDEITDDVYADVVSNSRYNVTTDATWNILAEACNKSENKKVMKTIVNALERKGHYSHIVPSLKRESKLECRCSEFSQLRVDFKMPTDNSEDGGSTISPLSSVDDLQFPCQSDSQELLSSISSIDTNEDGRNFAIRMHVLQILSQAQNCMNLTDRSRTVQYFDPNTSAYQRQRSNSFVKNRKFPTGMQRRKSCNKF